MKCFEDSDRGCETPNRRSHGKGALPKIPKECGKIATNVPEMSLTWVSVSNLLEPLQVQSVVVQVPVLVIQFGQSVVSSIRPILPSDRYSHARHRLVAVPLPVAQESSWLGSSD